jgi:uncharacterized protein YbcI
MSETAHEEREERHRSNMAAVSNAMVKLHKEQFGRGPTKAKSNFAGPNTLVCTLEDVLLPAEHKLIALGQEERVRDSRTSFQVATESDFISAIEQILYRKVRAFASAVDPKADVIYEIFTFEGHSSDGEDG